MVEGDEGVNPWGWSRVGEDGLGGGSEAVTKCCECRRAGGGITHCVVELEARRPPDVVQASKVVSLASFAQGAPPCVGTLSWVAVGFDNEVRACAIGVVGSG
jgi:hypothetical protein